ncbi:hypothetical protein NX059_009055 [Plenodomus lindquistii]|nr:hypothetical protein NX059_009055 [Plenodomus lindquistii]
MHAQDLPTAIAGLHLSKIKLEQQAEKTQKNRMVSPLLRLPAEIRNMIYAHTLNVAILVRPITRHPAFIPASQVHGSIALLLASRQINSEASSLIRTIPTFTLTEVALKTLPGALYNPSQSVLAFELTIRSVLTSIEMELQLAVIVVTSDQAKLRSPKLKGVFPALRRLTVTSEVGEIISLWIGRAKVTVGSADESNVASVKSHRKFARKLCRAFGMASDNVKVSFELE